MYIYYGLVTDVVGRRRRSRRRERGRKIKTLHMCPAFAHTYIL